MAVAVTPDGATVMATGSSQGDYMTIAYDAATGQKRWKATYDGPDHQSDFPFRIAITPDGSTAVVTGNSDGADFGRFAIATVAYDVATGAQRWKARYTGPENLFSDGFGLAISPDGSEVVVTGDTTVKVADSFSQDLVTIAYATADGAPLWDRRYDGVGHATDVGVAAAFANGGSSVVVAGSSGSSSYGDILVWYDAKTGHKQRQRLPATPAGSSKNAGSVDLAVTPDGATIVEVGAADGQIVTNAYEAASGHRLWSHAYAAALQSFGLVAVTPDGATVAVAGRALGDSGGYATVAYDIASGQELWDQTYHGPGSGSDSANSIAVTPDGSAFVVTGSSTGTTSGSDIVTTEYNALTGKTMLLRRYNGPASGNDGGRSVAVAPDSKAAFVTGWSAGVGTGTGDLITIAFPLAS
jgi:WD40 repeat protein